MKASHHLSILGAVLLGGTLFACGHPAGESQPAAGKDQDKEKNLTVTLKPGQQTVVAGKDQKIIIKVEITGPKGKPKQRLPLNLAVVLDRSGSMGGAKIEQARQAALQLIDQLQPTDMISIVAYDDDVEVLVPAQKVEDKKALRRQIEGIRSGGSTALHAGVKEGGEQLERYLSEKNINRVLLLSDGLANVGPSSNQAIAKLGRVLSRKSMSVTTIGLGADYNEDLMAALAEASDANYYYVQDVEKLPEIFEEELGELMAVTARDVKVIITTANGVKPLRLLGRDETFANGKTEVRFGPMASGQTRYLLLECEVPAAVAGSKKEIAIVDVAYHDVDGKGLRTAHDEVAVVFSDSEEEAEDSIDHQVTADAEIQLAAIAKREAIDAADKGDYRLAGARLQEQAASIRTKAAAAPAAERDALLEEARQLSSFANEVEEGGMSKTTRKSMQKDYYDKRNAK